MPSVSARFGLASPSMASTLRPSRASSRAIVPEMDVLPAPPFPATAIFMPGMSLPRWRGVRRPVAGEARSRIAGARAAQLPGGPLDGGRCARMGAPAGAVVVADYQASPRGRGGRPWQVMPGVGLAFSLILRPQLAPARDGWLYVVALCAIADVLGPDARFEWPDEARVGEQRAASVGVQADLGPPGPPWAVVSVIVDGARPPRAPLLGRVVEAIEARDRSPAAALLNDYSARCATLGRAVRARLLPLGPAGGEGGGRERPSPGSGTDPGGSRRRPRGGCGSPRPPGRFSRTRDRLPHL